MKAKIAHTNRTTQYPINELILNRWSPRAMSGTMISQEQLFSLFEAARWAPSSYNNQPWKFIYAQRTDPEWNDFLDLLVPFNKEWAQHAAVLIIIASDTLFAYNKKPSRTHAFDTGAAWQNMALQASSMGLVAHGMEGFNYTKAAALAQLPDSFQVHAMCAIGAPGDTATLSEEMRKQETPSNRNSIESFAFKGNFKG
ncbi:MAG TPA: nitroreductase family protein [Candidatus Babeliales bacterium]|nr:nitroreductase family protein [Candidatus Babeliales bacterium]